jgi:hypothetical protein
MKVWVLIRHFDHGDSTIEGIYDDYLKAKHAEDTRERKESDYYPPDIEEWVVE